jgi:hypothetical protein
VAKLYEDRIEIDRSHRAHLELFAHF